MIGIDGNAWVRSAVVTCLFVVLTVACGGDNGETPSVSVRAEVVEADAPVAVEATAVRETEEGLLAHGVRVTWQGDEAARLDDARFTHHATAGDSDLVTAGRGCGAQWDDGAGQLLQACTADLQLIDLRPGETHEYPVRVYREVGPLRLEAGTYVVDEVIGWRPVNENPPGDVQGRFIVRLTYEAE